ncbi:MAG TPA: hypothetical protein DEA90_11365 [Opitutae bacterium]|nr:hypothetical protein [Puniceicoccaceae bacterium]HBR94752.1 hypothetical protein [Opitutae bacterium]|tara:strand:- start:131 stop:397 length:267 start_codon:yes stop_codon:yes gene_type:complete
MNRIGKPHSYPSNKPPAHLIGVGLDNKDGHKRITKAERFAIVGGSQETHERMTETVVKTFEALDRKGKTLDSIDKKELNDIIKDSTPK